MGSHASIISNQSAIFMICEVIASVGAFLSSHVPRMIPRVFGEAFQTK